MRKEIISFALLSILLILYSCGGSNRLEFNVVDDPLYDIASVVTLGPGENIIFLDDFIEEFENIDSVFYSEGNYTYDKESHKLIINIDQQSAPVLSNITIRKSKNDYVILCRLSLKLKKELYFTPRAGSNYSTVSIAGDFNSWNSTSHILEKTSEGWKISLELDPGLYQYQIVADGKWMNNPDAGDTVPNGIGGYNTVLNNFSACNADALVLNTHSFDDESVTITVSQTPDQMFILWQNQMLPVELKNFDSNKYTFKIPQESAEMKRSYFRVYAATKSCLSNDLYIPLQNGKVLFDSEQVLRSDKFSNIMYFILVDRFCNANTNNDFPLKDSRVADRANYLGGDLYGVLDKLKSGYFEKIGVSCLWISPVFANPDEAYQEFPEPHRFYSGYHGYWPISSTEIDYRLGNDSVFKALSDEVHSRGMNIILDFVANHVHQNHPLYQQNKNWATDLVLADGRQNIRLWDEQRLTTWFDTFLPSWDFENLEVTDTISEYALYWLRKFDLDGFRHDATKHIPEIFWRTLTNKTRLNFPDKSIYQIGETFGSRELIASYVGSGMMDGQFDFNLYFDARNCFSGNNCEMSNLANSLKTSLSYYGHHNLMGNITGNHDLIRFITYADGSVKPGEDDKEAGWDRIINVQNSDSYNKLQNLTAFILTIPGIPCIYYGDEIGLPGAGDPDNRRMMKFENLSETESQNLHIFSKLTALRKSRIEMLLGELNIIETGKNILIYKRTYFGSISYIIFNQSDAVSEILISKSEIGDINNFQNHFDSEIVELSSNYQIKIKPFSFEILTSN